jgi:hypothetical protein
MDGDEGTLQFPLNRPRHALLGHGGSGTRRQDLADARPLVLHHVWWILHANLLVENAGRLPKPGSPSSCGPARTSSRFCASTTSESLLRHHRARAPFPAANLAEPASVPCVGSHSAGITRMNGGARSKLIHAAATPHSHTIGCPPDRGS